MVFGKHDQLTSLAFLDVATELAGLLEGQPQRVGVALVYRSGP